VAARKENHAMRIRFSRVRGLLAGAVLALGVTSPLQGADFSDRGLYLGVSGAYATSLFQEKILSYAGLPASAAEIGDSKGFGARLGYRAMSWLALEVQYEWLDTFDFSNSTLGKFAEYRPQTVTANLKLFLPSGSVQPYLLVGAGISFWELDMLPFPGEIPSVPGGQSSGEGFSGRAGLGLNVHLSKHIALNAEATAVLNTTTLDLDQTNFDQTIGDLYYVAFSAGLTYRF
jgi:opacity protein-like surface antigen